MRRALADRLAAIIEPAGRQDPDQPLTDDQLEREALALADWRCPPRCQPYDWHVHGATPLEAAEALIGDHDDRPEVWDAAVRLVARRLARLPRVSPEIDVPWSVI